ncbi:MAG TPA: phosphoribosylglycinamide synthetase C domain-containing protein [Candidatus Pacearchaeota archaeon]|nr:phosphoribosylamine--glycine ligase [Candidatus Parcubacteria bacterium]HOU46029.1 phosphoribosylglycinamide synthetase C domain-containing protein [Candidatus Pacearchaeota archaeon]HPM08468.1 phosphoribosylglycinamide synthetase C domain-containing protein [Candidatus Pacearchaeota archaeon]HQI74761.1 phosphoribosylglycinamide synthetase C domain-containing protein [Candidatus Pacearchaeota archaeon]
MEQKNFLFISLTGLISDVAWQVKKEGHNVKFYIRDNDEKDIGDGFVEKTDDWEKEVDWADVIIFDDTLGQGEKAKALREKGKLVVGGSPYTDRLEDDRSFGQEELKNAGIPIIPYKNFTSFDEAIEFVKSKPDKYVIKPSGEAGNIKILLFVGEEENGQDVISILEAYKTTWAKSIQELQLQKKISGVEIAVGAYFNGNEFIYPININFEHKKLFPGNLGPSTGEMGTNMFWSEPNRLFNATLKKMEVKLREEHYVGYIDLNCIVNGSGIFPLEFTARFGYPTIFIQEEGITMPISEFLYRLASGENFAIKTKKGFQVGARIIVPPYPFDDPATFEAYSKNAAVLFKKNNLEGIHIEDMKLVDGEWLVAGSAGVILTVVGTGTTMKQAQNDMFQKIKNITVPNMYYRTDIGDRWFEDSDKLHNWGYLRET